MPFDASTLSTAQIRGFGIGTTVTDTFSVGGSGVAMFAIDLVAGRTYEIDADDGNDTFLRIFDAFGVEVFRNDDGTDTGEAASGNPYAQFMAAYAGRYYIAFSPYYLRDYDPATTAGRVSPEVGLPAVVSTVTVTDSGPEFFPDSSSITSITAGGPANETSHFASGGGPSRIEYAQGTVVSATADVEMGRFDLVKGDVIVVDINGRDPAAPLDSILRVFTASGTEIGFDDNSGAGEDTELVFAANATGTFYIAVSGQGNSTYNPVTGDGAVVGDDGVFTAILHRNPTAVGTSASNNRVLTEGHDYAALMAGNDTADGGDGRDTLSGGDDSDSLIGNAGRDQLYGDADNDRLFGGGNTDVLVGGNGLDSLFGGISADILEGGLGDDSLRGGTGLDTLDGGAGIDALFGEGGADILRGGADNDSLSGGDEADTLQGNGGNDSLTGDAGNDEITGEQGNDTLFGITEDDNLSGEAGADVLFGGLGDDTLWGGSDNDTLSGAAGADTFAFSGIIGGGVDTITFFDNANVNERISLIAIFAGAGVIVNAGNLDQFVQTTPAGAGNNAFLAVDANGLTGGLSFTIIAQVNGVTAAQLFDIGNFLV